MADEKAWVKVQQKTFTKWMNSHLRKKKFPEVEDVETGFEDGIALMNVMHVLFDVPIPRHNKKPKMRPQKLDNLALAFKMIEEAQVKTNFLKTHQLIDHDLKMILGMLWAFILEYQIKGISVDEMTAKEGLLLWVQKKTKGYRDVDPPGVHNFHTHWKNGMALCALIHRHRPNLIDYDSLDKNNAADNLELAFSVAEKELDIPRLLDVSDLTDAVRPDERSVMTYISEFFHRFASEDIKEQAALRVQNFIKFMRQMEALQNDYERRARALLEFTQTQSDAFTNHQFGDNYDAAVEDFANLKAYLTQHKPEKLGEKLDVEALYAEIQTELAVNGRRPYEPPADVAPDAVASAFVDLAGVEEKYSAECRTNRFRFIQKVEYKVPEEKLLEIQQAFKHFDKSGDHLLDKIEFKAALQALGVPFKDDAAFLKVFNKVSSDGQKITEEEYIKYNTSLLEMKDTPEQVKASFAMIADQSNTVTEEQLSCPPLDEEDQQWLKSKMTQGDDGTYDYSSFVDTVFVEEQQPE